MSAPEPVSAEATCPDCDGTFEAPAGDGCKRPWHHAEGWATGWANDPPAPIAADEAGLEGLANELAAGTPILASDWLAGVVATARAEALRETADEWQYRLRRDAALYDYGRWLDAAANMLRARAAREATR